MFGIFRANLHSPLELDTKGFTSMIWDHISRILGTVNAHATVELSPGNSEAFLTRFITVHCTTSTVCHFYTSARMSLCRCWARMRLPITFARLLRMRFRSSWPTKSWRFLETTKKIWRLFSSYTHSFDEEIYLSSGRMNLLKLFICSRSVLSAFAVKCFMK